MMAGCQAFVCVTEVCRTPWATPVVMQCRANVIEPGSVPQEVSRDLCGVLMDSGFLAGPVRKSTVPLSAVFCWLVTCTQL